MRFAVCIEMQGDFSGTFGGGVGLDDRGDATWGNSW